MTRIREDLQIPIVRQAKKDDFLLYCMKYKVALQGWNPGISLDFVSFCLSMDIYIYIYICPSIWEWFLSNLRVGLYFKVLWGPDLKGNKQLQWHLQHQALFRARSSFESQLHLSGTASM